MEKFESTGSVKDVRHTTQAHIDRSLRNSLRKSGQKFRDVDSLSYIITGHYSTLRYTLHRIFTKDLQLHAYIVQISTNYAQRGEFTNWTLKQTSEC